MKITFLGTNGWYDTETGNTICILVQTREHVIIFDAGNGFCRIDQYIKVKKEIGFVFLSHFHLDHVEGLHTLNKLQCFKRVIIAGPAGTKKTLSTLLNAPFTVALPKLHYSAEVIELPSELGKLPFKLEVSPLLHAELTLGYRLEADGKVVTYCPDTGYCENAIMLARSTDLLIAECAYRVGEQNSEWPHLNPETAARIALESGARRLALVHFDASRYDTVESRKMAERHAQSIFVNTLAASDHQVISI